MLQSKLPLLGLRFHKINVMTILNPFELLLQQHTVATDRNELAELLSTELLILTFTHGSLDYLLEVIPPLVCFDSS